MPEQDKPQQQGNRRSHRRAPVIELKAEEVIQNMEAAKPEVASVTEPAPEPIKPATEAQAEPAAAAPAAPEAETKPVSQPEPLSMPSPPAEKPRMALPLASAALLGAVFGGLGGTVVPSLLGSGGAVDPARIAALETRQAALPQIQQKLTALEGDVARRAAEASVPVAQNLQKLEGEVRALANRPASPAAGPAIDLGPLQQRIVALEAQLKALDAKADGAVKAAGDAARASDPRLAALDQKVDQAARRLEAGSAAPLFSAVQGLAQAFHRGAPFLNEITAVELLGAKPEQLAALKPLAEKGAPTAQRLADAFAPLASRLAGGDQGGIMGFISRFITIRPTEESAGNQPAAIVGSIEGALRRGDIAAAVMAWNRLPEATRTASAAWGTEAARRDQAAKALAALQDAATAALRK